MKFDFIDTPKSQEVQDMEYLYFHTYTGFEESFLFFSNIFFKGIDSSVKIAHYRAPENLKILLSLKN